MKPITNILLVLALILYVFLPFYDISFIGTVTGLKFTAGTISQALSLHNVLLALLPFVACFGAIVLNSLKSRWWVIGAIACIFIWLLFYLNTNNLHDIMLHHAPEVTPDNDLGEGFSITGLGIGYKLSFLVTALSLLSAIVSLLPFEFNRLESNLHKPHRSKHGDADAAATPPIVDDTPALPVEEDKEDPSRFMPRQ